MWSLTIQAPLPAAQRAQLPRLLVVPRARLALPVPHREHFEEARAFLDDEGSERSRSTLLEEVLRARKRGFDLALRVRAVQIAKYTRPGQVRAQLEDPGVPLGCAPVRNDPGAPGIATIRPTCSALI